MIWESWENRENQNSYDLPILWVKYLYFPSVIIPLNYRNSHKKSFFITAYAWFTHKKAIRAV